MEQVDQGVENRGGQRLAEIVLVAPAVDEIPQGQRIACDTDLVVAGQFTHAIQPVQGIEVAPRIRPL